MRVGLLLLRERRLSEHGLLCKISTGNLPGKHRSQAPGLIGSPCPSTLERSVSGSQQCLAVSDISRRSGKLPPHLVKKTVEWMQKARLRTSRRIGFESHVRKKVIGDQPCPARLMLPLGNPIQLEMRFEQVIWGFGICNPAARSQNGRPQFRRQQRSGMQIAGECL
jgi:hypothetical protein